MPRIPQDVHLSPVDGHDLNVESEGLVLLTSDSVVNQSLYRRRHELGSTYLVQVEGTLTDDALNHMTNGKMAIDLGKGRKRYLPSCRRISGPPPGIDVYELPLRDGKPIPSSWISVTMRLHKSAVLRQMVEKVGYPVLRLIKYSVSGMTLKGLQPGEWKEHTREECYNKLGIVEKFSPNQDTTNESI